MSELYFNADKIGDPQKCYVAFLDIMGMQNHLVSNLKTSANFMFKFHEAILNAEKACDLTEDSMKVYPIMDGAYITSPEAWQMRKFLSTLFSDLANLYLKTDNETFRFVPRGSVSYGEVYHGCDIPDEAAYAFSQERRRRNSLLIGRPMVKAYHSERSAAPFGIYIDECACCNIREDQEHFYRSWKWFKTSSDFEAYDTSLLSSKLLKTFERLAKIASNEVDASRHNAHCRAIRQYFELDS